MQQNFEPVTKGCHRRRSQAADGEAAGHSMAAPPRPASVLLSMARRRWHTITPTVSVCEGSWLKTSLVEGVSAWRSAARKRGPQAEEAAALETEEKTEVKKRKVAAEAYMQLEDATAQARDQQTREHPALERAHAGRENGGRHAGESRARCCSGASDSQATAYRGRQEAQRGLWSSLSHEGAPFLPGGPCPSSGVCAPWIFVPWHPRDSTHTHLF